MNTNQGGLNPQPPYPYQPQQGYYYNSPFGQPTIPNYFPPPPTFSSFIPQQPLIPPPSPLLSPPTFTVYSPPPLINQLPLFHSSGVVIPPPQPPPPIPLTCPSTPQQPQQPQQPSKKKKNKWVVSYIPNEEDCEKAKKDIEETSDGWVVTDTGKGDKRALAKKHCRWESHGYCRSYNLKFHPQVCQDKHRFCRAQGVKLTQPPLRSIGSNEAEYFRATSFLKDWQGAKQPTVKGLYRIDVPHLDILYDKRKQFIESMNGTATEMTLYHGTRESALMDIYCNGFAMPADFAPGTKCKKSGMLPSSVASLCASECKKCSDTPHIWSKCHMFGLGVYFALQSNKSDIYVTDMNGNKPNTGRKMLICDVVLGKAKPVNQLKKVDEMHDMVLPPSGYHSIHAIGMGVNASIPTGYGGQLAVKLDEFIIFHPHQAVPRYLLEYDL